jgi:hypothetical protein
MEVKVEGNTLVIRMPIVPHPSKSGKNMLIASTHGNVMVMEKYEGKPITISVNAYVNR